MLNTMGGIVVNSGNVTAVQRCREFEINRRSIVSFIRKPVSRDGLYDNGYSESVGIATAQRMAYLTVRSHKTLTVGRPHEDL